MYLGCGGGGVKLDENGQTVSHVYSALDRHSTHTHTHTHTHTPVTHISAACCRHVRV